MQLTVYFSCVGKRISCGSHPVSLLPYNSQFTMKKIEMADCQRNFLLVIEFFKMLFHFSFWFASVDHND